jgi:hypothetical protein
MQPTICPGCYREVCQCHNESTRQFSIKGKEVIMPQVKIIPTQTRENTTLPPRDRQVLYAQERAMRDRYTDPKLRDLLTDAQAVSNILGRISTHDIQIPASWMPQDARPGESWAQYEARLNGRSS